MIQIYHPNKNNTGFACSFSQSNKDNTIYSTLIKQSGWDINKKIGIFKDSKNDPLKNVNIKLEQVEVGAILDCIDKNRPFSTMHDGEKYIKSIQFIPWMNKVAEGEKSTQKGYSFSITTTNKEDSTSKNSFYIGLTFAESRLIREFLIFSLRNAFVKPVVKDF
jgi:hypothetical protein